MYWQRWRTWIQLPSRATGVTPDADQIKRNAQAVYQKAASVAETDQSKAIRLLFTHGWPLGLDGVVRLHEFLARANNLLLAPLLTLIIAEVYLDGLPSIMERDYGAMSVAFSTLFGLEWIIGLVLAPKPRAYLINPWLVADLASALPLGYVIQFARGTRFVRLIRLVKLSKLLRARRAKLPFRRIAWAAGVALSASLSGAIALQAVEPSSAPQRSDALWWAIVTTSTVGYGDISPTTDAGRVIGVVLILTGVGVFSYLAGVMSSTVFDPEEDELLRRVKAIEAMMQDRD